MNNVIRVLGFVLVALLAPVASAQNLIILDVEEDAEDILFDQPISSPDEALDGRSLEQLIGLYPLFAPIEGLPKEVWADKSCNGCHQWERASLCAQAQFYLSESGRASLNKQHPFGGGFKSALRSWGVQGCR